MELEDKIIYILDSTVFLENVSHMFNGKIIVTTPLISEEMKSSRAVIEFEKLLLEGMELLMPSQENIRYVEKQKEKTKDKLSKTDISVIALAKQFKDKNKQVKVVSDDYGVQNVCSSLGISFMPLTQKGISKEIKWTRICPACKKKQEKSICEFCGSETKVIPKASQTLH